MNALTDRSVDDLTPDMIEERYRPAADMLRQLRLPVPVNARLPDAALMQMMDQDMAAVMKPAGRAHAVMWYKVIVGTIPATRDASEEDAETFSRAAVLAMQEFPPWAFAPALSAMSQELSFRPSIAEIVAALRTATGQMARLRVYLRAAMAVDARRREERDKVSRWNTMTDADRDEVIDRRLPRLRAHLDTAERQARMKAPTACRPAAERPATVFSEDATKIWEKTAGIRRDGGDSS